MKLKIRKALAGVALLLSALALMLPAFRVSADEKYGSTGSGENAPPMGFNTWYTYLDGFDEGKIKELVTAMDRKGLRRLGYQYIQIDWGWCAEDRGYSIRDADGKMVPDPAKFSSMKALANYLHRRGFRIGYYTDIGISGCGNGIGSYGHYAQDIEQFLEWDADLIKLDSCGGHVDYADHNEAYRAVLDCLKKSGSGRKVGVNICCGGGYGVTDFICPMADDYVGDVIPFVYYRTCQDISATIPKVLWEDDTYGVLKSFDMAMAHPENSKPGCYFDLDTLMLENNGLTDEENKSYFTLFCIAPSTLMLAVDVPNISDRTLEIISNEEAIAVNQDPLCNPSRLVREDAPGLQVWSKIQSDTNGRRTRAVTLFNRSGKSERISVSWEDIGLSGDCTVRDLWEHRDMGVTADGYSAEVPSHGVVLLLVTEKAGEGSISETGSGTGTQPSESTGSGTGKADGNSTKIIITAALVAVIAVIGVAAVIIAVKNRGKR